MSNPEESNTIWRFKYFPLKEVNSKNSSLILYNLIKPNLYITELQIRLSDGYNHTIHGCLNLKNQATKNLLKFCMHVACSLQRMQRSIKSRKSFVKKYWRYQINSQTSGLKCQLQMLPSPSWEYEYNFNSLYYAIKMDHNQSYGISKIFQIDIRQTKENDRGPLWL